MLHNFYGELFNAVKIGMDDETIKGYLSYNRIDSKTVPNHYSKYEIRHDDTGTPAILEDVVFVDFYGTLLVPRKFVDQIEERMTRSEFTNDHWLDLENATIEYTGGTVVFNELSTEVS